MNSRIVIFWIFCFFLEIPILRAQDADLPGSHDHSLLPRLPGFYIRNFDENRYDFENFRTNDGETRVEGHKYVIDYYLQSNKTPQGKAYILQRYSDILEEKGAKVMFKGPYYSIFKIPRANSETWVKVDPGNYDGKRYFLTIVEKETMKQEVGLNRNTGSSSNEKDVTGSKDYLLLPRMPDFYIGGYEETKQTSETFATTSGDIETSGHKFYIDYYLEDGKIPPGKIQILENYKTVLLNAKAEILLDGVYYDVYKVQNKGGEAWIKIDPGNYDGKRYEITVVEKTGLTSINIAKKEHITTDALVMTGLNPKDRIIRTNALQMTGLNSSDHIIQTAALMMTGLNAEDRIIRTSQLEMTGLKPSDRIIKTKKLTMTGLAQ